MNQTGNQKQASVVVPRPMDSFGNGNQDQANATRLITVINLRHPIISEAIKLIDNLANSVPWLTAAINRLGANRRR